MNLPYCISLRKIVNKIKKLFVAGMANVSYTDLKGARSALTADYSYADMRIDGISNPHVERQLTAFLKNHGFKEGDRFCTERGEKQILTPDQLKELQEILGPLMSSLPVVGGGSSANTMVTISHLLNGVGFKTDFLTLVAGLGDAVVAGDYEGAHLTITPGQEEIKGLQTKLDNLAPKMPAAYVYNYENLDDNTIKGSRFHFKEPPENNTTKEFVRARFTDADGNIDINALRPFVRNAGYLFLQGSAWDKFGQDFMNSLMGLRWQYLTGKDLPEEEKQYMRSLPLVMTLPTNPLDDWKNNYGWTLPSANVIFSNMEELCRHFNVPDMLPSKTPKQTEEEYRAKLREHCVSISDEYNRLQNEILHDPTPEHISARAIYLDALAPYASATDRFCTAMEADADTKTLEQLRLAVSDHFHAMMLPAEEYSLQQLNYVLVRGRFNIPSDNNGTHVQQVAFVTLGSKGIMVVEPGVSMERVAVPDRVAERLEGQKTNSVGTGDTCYAGILFGLQLGLSPAEAAMLGNILAATKLLLPTSRHTNPLSMFKESSSPPMIREKIEQQMQDVYSQEVNLALSPRRGGGGAMMML